MWINSLLITMLISIITYSIVCFVAWDFVTLATLQPTSRVIILATFIVVWFMVWLPNKYLTWWRCDEV